MSTDHRLIFLCLLTLTETLIRSKENNHVLVAEYVHDNYIVCLQEVYAYLHTQFSGSNRLLRLDGMYYEAMDQ